MRISAS